jgi:hypothetical protein
MSGRRDDRLTQIGLDRLVRLKWLEQTASLVLAGNGDKETKEALQASLKDFFRSHDPDVRGSIDKTITILLKVWLRVPAELEQLRIGGLELLRHVPRTDRLAIHWGMVTAVYPFWSSVAAQVGRLLRLQGSASAAHIQRRMREQYGERDTVSRRARYVLRSYLDWGVLGETGTKGIYKAGLSPAVDNPRLIAWIVEASLHARSNGSAPLKDVINSPSLFPFRLKAVHAESLMAVAPNLDIFRHGLDDDMVMLRKRSS